MRHERWNISFDPIFTRNLDYGPRFRTHLSYIRHLWEEWDKVVREETPRIKRSRGALSESPNQLLLLLENVQIVLLSKNNHLQIYGYSIVEVFCAKVSNLQLSDCGLAILLIPGRLSGFISRLLSYNSTGHPGDRGNLDLSCKNRTVLKGQRPLLTCWKSVDILKSWVGSSQGL